MTLDVIKQFFRRRITVIAGGPTDLTRGTDELAVLDALADVALGSPNNRPSYRKAVRFFSSNTPNYVAGELTLASLNPEFCALHTECVVEFSPAGYTRTYQLHYDSLGPVMVYREFGGSKLPASWALTDAPQVGVPSYSYLRAVSGTAGYSFRIDELVRDYAGTITEYFFAAKVAGVLPPPSSPLGDASWRRVSADELPTAATRLNVTLTWAGLNGLRQDEQYQPGTQYTITGRNNGAGPDVVVRAISSTQLANEDAYTVTYDQGVQSRQPVVYNEYRDDFEARAWVSPDIAAAAFAADNPNILNPFATRSAVSLAVQNGFNTAPILYAYRDDGSQRTDFITVEAATFWADGDGYGGLGGYVVLTRPSFGNPLLGQGTVLNLNNNPLRSSYVVALYGGAKILNNRLIYGGLGIVLRYSNATLGSTYIQGGVLDGRIIAGSDYTNVLPLVLDGVKVINSAGDPYVTVNPMTIIMRNGSAFVGCVPDPSAIIIYEDAIALDPVTHRLPRALMPALNWLATLVRVVDEGLPTEHTADDPAALAAGVAAWLQSLPGWANNNSVSLRGNMTWATTGTTPANSAPYASNVLIAGSPVVGLALVVTYDFNDADNDAEATSLIQWYHGPNPAGIGRTLIAGQNADTYTVQAGDLGQNIWSSVTAVAASGDVTGAEVFSSNTAAVTAPASGAADMDKDFDQETNGTHTANSYHGTDPAQGWKGVVNLKIPAGDYGYFRMALTADQVSARIILDRNLDQPQGSSYENDFAIWGEYGEVITTNHSSNAGTGIAAANGVLVQLRVGNPDGSDTGTIRLEVSSDNGATWTAGLTKPTDGEDLYFKLYGDAYQVAANLTYEGAI